MKSIRNIIAFMAIGATVFLASCAKDENDPTGTGDARDKFTGTWTCNENSQQQGNSTYSMTIVKDPGSASQVIATNFYALGSSTNTYIGISGNNMSISTQNPTATVTVSGSGSYSNGNLSFSFSADDGQTVDQVTVNAHH
jgi:hypothetical protein